MLRTGLIAALAAALLSLTPARAAGVTVFAAASLSEALTQAGEAYKQETGESVAFSFAASSGLARQIEVSPGADIFVSADTDWMDYLEARGLIERASRVELMGNRLVLIAPAHSNAALSLKPRADLAAALRGGRLALADPASVPAGKYAKAALASLGMWDGIADKVAPAENVRVALAYVARGEAPLGIVYATDAKMEPRVRVVGIFPVETHPRIVYPAALIKNAKPEARAFLEYLKGARAGAIFERAGFTLVRIPYAVSTRPQ
jgi:molybdate transport system substrate-binding protein